MSQNELSQNQLSQTTLDELQQIIDRYPQPRSALLPMLHLLQSVQGSVTTEGIETCAEMLDLTPAEVSGVSTFYTMYKRNRVGKHLVGVCTNTLCAIMGGDAIFERLKDHLDVDNDETTDDGAVTLEHIECNAACDYAPVMMVNWEFFDNQTPQSATELVDQLRAGEPVCSTRGAAITSWRDTERVLAGFDDDKADEGPSGGPESLVGLRVAEHNGWHAPPAQASGTTGSPADTAMESAQISDSTTAETDTLAAETDTAADAGQGPDESENDD